MEEKAPEVQDVQEQKQEEQKPVEDAAPEIKTTPKAKSKSQVKRNATTAGLDVESELKKFEEKAKAGAEKIEHEVVKDVEKFVKELEGKSMQELMALHSLAITEEDKAKRELHLLRLRAANMLSTVGPEVEKDITLAKEKVAQAIEWLHAIEARLRGVPRDIWGEKYGRVHHYQQ